MSTIFQWKCQNQALKSFRSFVLAVKRRYTYNIAITYSDDRQCYSDNRKYKYMYITTNQPDIKSYTNPNTNPNPNPSTKQHTIVSIQLNIATCPKLRLRNDLYCVGWGVKLYSLTYMSLVSREVHIYETILLHRFYYFPFPLSLCLP